MVSQLVQKTHAVTIHANKMLKVNLRRLERVCTMKSMTHCTDYTYTHAHTPMHTDKEYIEKSNLVRIKQLQNVRRNEMKVTHRACEEMGQNLIEQKPSMRMPLFSCAASAYPLPQG